jgi:putative transposase
MAHTFSNLLCHLVFSTKDRLPHMDSSLRERLFPYMGGIVREMRGTPMIVNGPDDHVHMLAAVPPAIAIADFVRTVKTNSSRWVHEQWQDRRAFAWQTGYGAFSVSQSLAPIVRQYIADQEEHHQRMTFQEEFLALLKRHGIAYDERFI